MKNGIACHVLVLSLIVLLQGCTVVNSSSVPIGDPRPPIDPESVKLYRTPPAEYEEIALVSASAGHDFRSSQGVMNSAIKRLKEEAAKVGANGVILEYVSTRKEGQVTTSVGTAFASGSGGTATATGTTVSVNHGDRYNRLKGTAVFVIRE